MNDRVDRWLLQNMIEPARVVAEYRGYWRGKGQQDVIVRIKEHLLDGLTGADPAARPRMKYLAEVVSLKGQLLATGNPDMTPELALDNLHPHPMGD